jgi:hypothetical protein
MASRTSARSCTHPMTARSPLGLLALLTALAGGDAGAEKAASTGKTAVMPLGADPGVAEAQALRVRQAVRASLEENGAATISVAEADRLLLTVEDAACTKPACLGKVAAALGAAQLVGGRLAREGKKGASAAWTLSLWLFDARQGATLATTEDRCESCTLDEAATFADRVAAKLVREVAAAATGGSGRFDIRTHPSGARVKIDGNAVGITDGVFGVGPGVHTVALELEGHVLAVRSLRAAAGKTERLEVALEKAGGEAAGKVGGEGGRAGATGGGGAVGVLKWVTLGAAVAGIAAGIALVVVDGREGCDRQYDKIACQKLTSTMAPGAALLAVGAAAGVTSGVLFWLDSKTTSGKGVKSTAIAPWVRDHSAGLGAAFSY